MQPQDNIISCYSKTAKAYADKFIDELAHKHLDQILLQSFAAENKDRGKMIDLGCGPGQTTKYLSGCGITDLLGVDVSPAMIDVAKHVNPQLQFETADMLDMNYKEKTFGSAIAFYAIVHFDYEQVKTAFTEIRKVLKKGGQFLFSFHTGDSIIHLENFLDHEVSIDFHFFETNKIIPLLIETGFEITDVIERRPYLGAEHVSIRAYIWASVSEA